MPSQTNRPPNDSLPLQGRRRPLIIVLFVLVLLFMITYASRLNEYRGLLKQETSIQAQIYDAEARGRQLAADLKYVRSPEYAEKVARTEIGLGRDGEHALAVIDAQTPAKAEQAQDPTADSVSDAEAVIQEGPEDNDEPSVWQQWLSIFNSPDD